MAAPDESIPPHDGAAAAGAGADSSSEVLRRYMEEVLSKRKKGGTPESDAAGPAGRGGEGVDSTDAGARSSEATPKASGSSGGAAARAPVTGAGPSGRVDQTPDGASNVFAPSDAPFGSQISDRIERGTLAALLAQSKPVTVVAVTSEQEVRFSALRLGVSLQDLIIFTRQLATMINSGMPLHQCMQALTKQTKNPLLHSQLEVVQKLLENGTSFSAALRRFPKTFSTLYTSLIEASEVAGNMDLTLSRLAAYLESVAVLRRQIRAAIVYPLTVSVVALVVVALMVFKVVPTFERMFASSSASLPLETQVVIQISNFAQDNILAILLAIAALVGAVGTWYLTPRGRFQLDRVLLRLPMVGDLVMKVAMARFCRTLATLLVSGVSILEALDVCTRIAGNRVVEAALQATRAGIVGGRTLAESLRVTGVFPPVVYHMLGVGESTGDLDGMLAKIADYYDEEVDLAVGGLVALLEPTFMVFLGVVIGGLLIAMYMPVFTMSTAVGQ